MRTITVTEVLMQVKRDILWTVLVLGSLLMGISLSASDWIACKHELPYFCSPA